MIIEQNKKGGLLGKKLEPVVVDPYVKLAAVRWKSVSWFKRQSLCHFRPLDFVSRKSVLPVVEELNSVLFYPVQYEGKSHPKTCFLYRCCTKPAGGDSSG